ncbi:MAG: alkaline phosphatase D family protein [Planctomycetaceae bacterium]|nr:alkaline phosphatase D family protein [Planctomycetaceae bacterium]
MRTLSTATVLLLIVNSAASLTLHGQEALSPDPVALDVLPYSTAGLAHGPLLGNVTATSVRLWLRTRSADQFEVVYDTQFPFSDTAKSVAGDINPARDGTGIVELRGLLPNTRYFYGVRIDGKSADLRENVRAPWPSFRTLPDAATCADTVNNPRGLFNVTFAVGHCASQDPDTSGGQYLSTPAYDSIRHHGDEVQFCIVNGDVTYEEGRDGTADGVRANYRLYLDRGRSFNQLFRTVPAMFTFDDHDVGWDIHGCGQIGLRDGRHLIRDIGLQTYEEYLSWANPDGPQRGRIRFGQATVVQGDDVLFDKDADFTTLDPATVSTIHLGNYTRGTSLKRTGKAPANAGVYGLTEVIDGQHLRLRPPARADETVSYSIGTHHYYDLRVANCHIFALDTRGERSDRNARDRNDPDLFILGEAQKQWFLNGVRQTDADFIFVISPDPWMIYHTAAHVGGDDQDDKGDGFPSFLREREELLAALDAIQKPVLIFTGDVHASACVRITNNVWEMMCGPLGSTGHPRGTLGNPPSGGKWASMGRDVDIRWVTGFPNNMPYERIRNTYYGIVQVNNVLKSGRPDGTGYQWTAFDEPQVIVRWHDGYTGRLVYAESVTTSDARDGS